MTVAMSVCVEQLLGPHPAKTPGQPLATRTPDQGRFLVIKQSSLSFHHDTKKAIELAAEAARQASARQITPIHMVLGLLELGRGTAYEFLRAKGITREQLLAALAEAAPEQEASPGAGT